MLLEQIINKTIEFYSKNKIAYIEKNCVPVNFKNVSKNEERIKVKGTIKQKSTVDYYGCYQGKFIAFEAKMTKSNRLEKTSVKTHQMNYLNKIEENGGIGFYVIYFFVQNKFFIISSIKLKKLNEEGSLSFEIIKKHSKEVPITFPGVLDFICYLV
ncbi:Holliday junction resolvase RecU [Mycoplasma sp. Ms02]|uniref:Holliday junction resolvase RecU n=1 Tax=Mycoplasma sp. Ms02 TaxID=353851 RepID=UPI001C8AA516|nr:Holliday junction resolvase RecU [Mycoplasma sp. Ms02]QZE12575.1 Holliday junction resolvase RecU [Mycoplasma sp. Ms02]